MAQTKQPYFSYPNKNFKDSIIAFEFGGEGGGGGCT
jgi:hypothetical protein